MERKQITIELKGDGDEGLVTARFGTSGVKDLDGDVIEQGAIGVQDIQVSQFGHASWAGGLPVGKGVTREDGDEMLADLEFFMETTHGRDHFETIKALGKLGQWSFGFEIKEERAPTEEERQLGIFRVLKKLEVFEVSPVLRGAGIDTATLDAKCDPCAVKAAAAADAAKDGGDGELGSKSEPEGESDEIRANSDLSAIFSADVAKAELFRAKSRHP